MAVKIGEQIFLNGTKPNIDAKFGPYESLNEAVSKLKSYDENGNLANVVGLGQDVGIYDRTSDTIKILTYKFVNLKSSTIEGYFERQYTSSEVSSKIAEIETKANEIISETETAKDDAIAATKDANTAKNNANNAADAANTAKDNADIATQKANEAATNANNVADSLQAAISSAESAAKKANDAAVNATDSSTDAVEKCNTAASNANEKAEKANDVTKEAEENIELMTAQLKNCDSKLKEVTEAINETTSKIDEADSKIEEMDEAIQSAVYADGEGVDVDSSIEEIVEGAENVNAELDGTTLKVTNRNGVTTSVDCKGADGAKGAQGNSGYTGAADELEVVNNLTDGGATAALSAEMGKELGIVINGEEYATESGYVFNNKGVLTARENGLALTEYIDVEPSSKIIWTSGLTESDFQATLCEYDASKTYLRQNYGTKNARTITLGSDTAYVRASFILTDDTKESIGLKNDNSEVLWKYGMIKTKSKFDDVLDAIPDVVNDFVTGGTTKSLSAEKGKELDAIIEGSERRYCSINAKNYWIGAWRSIEAKDGYKIYIEKINKGEFVHFRGAAPTPYLCYTTTDLTDMTFSQIVALSLTWTLIATTETEDESKESKYIMPIDCWVAITIKEGWNEPTIIKQTVAIEEQAGNGETIAEKLGGIKIGMKPFGAWYMGLGKVLASGDNAIGYVGKVNKGDRIICEGGYKTGYILASTTTDISNVTTKDDIDALGKDIWEGEVSTTTDLNNPIDWTASKDCWVYVSAFTNYDAPYIILYDKWSEIVDNMNDARERIVNNEGGISNIIHNYGYHGEVELQDGFDFYKMAARMYNSKKTLDNTQATLKKLNLSKYPYAHVPMFVIYDGYVYMTFMVNESRSDGEGTKSTTYDQLLVYFSLSRYESSDFDCETDVTAISIGKIGTTYKDGNGNSYTCVRNTGGNSIYQLNGIVYIPIAIRTEDSNKETIVTIKFDTSTKTIVSTIDKCTLSYNGTSYDFNRDNYISMLEVAGYDASGIDTMLMASNFILFNGKYWNSISNAGSGCVGALVSTSDFINYTLESFIPFNTYGADEIMLGYKEAYTTSYLIVACRQNYGYSHMMMATYRKDGVWGDYSAMPSGNSRPYIFNNYGYDWYSGIIYMMYPVAESDREVWQIVKSRKGYSGGRASWEFVATIEANWDYPAIVAHSDGEFYFAAATDTRGAIRFGKLKLNKASANTILSKLVTLLDS